MPESTFKLFRWLGRIVAAPGAVFLHVIHIFSVTWAVIVHSTKPSTWSAPARNVLARQVLFSGIEGVVFISLMALLIGVSVVLQASTWLSTLGQSTYVGPVLVVLVVREVGPLMTNFIVIGRSGVAIATEMSEMKVRGEVRVLDSLGIDPFLYLVVPRVVGVAVSVFALTVVFLVFSFVSGFWVGAVLRPHGASSLVLGRAVLEALEPIDFVNLLGKSLIPGLFTGAICCVEGLRVGSSVTEVPRAATRAVAYSVAALIVTSVTITVLTYS